MLLIADASDEDDIDSMEKVFCLWEAIGLLNIIMLLLIYKMSVLTVSYLHHFQVWKLNNSLFGPKSS